MLPCFSRRFQSGLGRSPVSNAAPVEAQEQEDAVAAPPAAGSGAKKKRMIFIAAALLLLGGGGGGGAYMMLAGGGDKAEAEGEDAPEAAAAFVDVPPMTVNLRSPDGQSRFLKLRFVLVPKEEAQQEALKEKLPLILDSFQPFLRELRPEDLAGSAAVFRLKEEMLVRAAGIAGSDMVRDVLIQDLIQQ